MAFALRLGTVRYAYCSTRLRVIFHRTFQFRYAQLWNVSIQNEKDFFIVENSQVKILLPFIYTFFKGHIQKTL